MGVEDTFGFDEDEYSLKLRSWSEDALLQEYRAKQAELSSYRTGGGITAGIAFFTGGLSLLGSAYMIRQASIARQQRDLIEAEVLRRANSTEVTEYALILFQSTSYSN